MGMFAGGQTSKQVNGWVGGYEGGREVNIVHRQGGLLVGRAKMEGNILKSQGR